LDEGQEEALAKGVAVGMRMAAMMPPHPASEGVENQQADKQGQDDQREIEKHRRVAEEVVKDYFGVTHTASGQYPQPPPMLLAAWQSTRIIARMPAPKRRQWRS
jgi:hypothetical protein